MGLREPERRLVRWLAVRAPFRRVGASRCRADVLSDAIAVGHPWPTEAPTRRNGARRLVFPTSLVAQRRGEGKAGAHAKYEGRHPVPCASRPLLRLLLLFTFALRCATNEVGASKRRASSRRGGASADHGWSAAMASDTDVCRQREAPPRRGEAPAASRRTTPPNQRNSQKIPTTTQLMCHDHSAHPNTNTFDQNTAGRPNVLW